MRATITTPELKRLFPLRRASFGRKVPGILGAIALVGISFAVRDVAAQTVTVPNEFVNGEIADANDVNQNFQTLEDAVNTNGLVLETIPAPANTIVVAKTGGHFDTVADAIASITDAGASNPYLVQVYPGVYDETQAIVVPGFVHLSGAGPGISSIRRSAGSATQNPEAAVITLESDSRLSAVRVENDDAANTFAFGVFGIGLSENTVVDDVDVVVNGSGGVGHYAFFFRDSDIRLRDSSGTAQGASTVNSGFASSDDGGPFAQPRIERCSFEANGVVSGLGIQLLATAADIFDSRIFGTETAISTSTSGITEIHGSEIESFGPVMSQTGASAVLLGGVLIRAVEAPQGIASQFKYVHCYKGDYDPIADGAGSTVN